MTASTLHRAESKVDLSGPTEEFIVETVHGESCDAVVVRGELDVATAPLLEAVLDAVISLRPRRLEVDLAGVTFLDAQALGTLNSARRRQTARHATLVLRRPSAIVRRVLALAGLDRLFDVVG